MRDLTIYNFQSSVMKAIENLPARYMYNEGIFTLSKGYCKTLRSYDFTLRGKAFSQCRVEYHYLERTCSNNR